MVPVENNKSFKENIFTCKKIIIDALIKNQNKFRDMKVFTV